MNLANYERKPLTVRYPLPSSDYFIVELSDDEDAVPVLTLARLVTQQQFSEAGTALEGWDIGFTSGHLQSLNVEHNPTEHSGAVGSQTERRSEQETEKLVNYMQRASFINCKFFVCTCYTNGTIFLAWINKNF